jgi:hypothetical protein
MEFSAGSRGDAGFFVDSAADLYTLESTLASIIV